MKKKLRIIFGTCFFIVPMAIGTFIWLFTEDKWNDTVGKYSWWLISGQWEKLPD